MNAPDEYWLPEPERGAASPLTGSTTAPSSTTSSRNTIREIASGLGDLEGDIWRIGCMGYSARPKTSSTSSRRWRTRWASRF